MHAIATTTIERRDPLGPGASDAQAVVEALLLHTLGGRVDLSPLPAAVADMIGEAIGTDGSGRRARHEGDRQRPHRCGALRAHRRRRAPRAAEPVPRQHGCRCDTRSRHASGRADEQPEATPGGGADDYSSAEMPPFMTPVLEELVKQRAKEQAEGADAGDAPDQAPESDQAMQTQEAQAGGERDEGDMAQRHRQQQRTGPGIGR